MKKTEHVADDQFNARYMVGSTAKILHLYLANSVVYQLVHGHMTRKKAKIP